MSEMKSHFAKLRERPAPFYANINMLGRCNANCFFCLGKDLNLEFAKYNTQRTHHTQWPRWTFFLERAKALGIVPIYLTGQNTDALLYPNLTDLSRDLRALGHSPGLRTNGFLALQRMAEINTFDRVGYSIHTFNPDTQFKIMGVRTVPDWADILAQTKTKRKRISVVLTTHNQNDLMRIIEFAVDHKVDYVQVRKVCTDARFEEMLPHALVWEETLKQMSRDYVPIDSFERAPIFDVNGVKVVMWKTVGTSASSINYFTNGVLSENYFVIEGYGQQVGINPESRDFLNRDPLTFPWWVKHET